MSLENDKKRRILDVEDRLFRLFMVSEMVGFDEFRNIPFVCDH